MVSPAPGCGRTARRLLAPLVAAAAAMPGADRYRKRFSAAAHLWVLLFHVLTGSGSLRQTHAAWDGTPGRWASVGVPGGVSRSQLARSSTSRPGGCAEALFAAVAARARAGADPAWRALTAVQAVDSTFLALSAALSPWSRHGGHAAGVRLHVGFDLAGGIPAHLILTGSEAHAAAAFDRRDPAELVGWTVVGDLGYYGHARFARLRAAGVSLICRLHGQAAYAVAADRPVPPITTPDGDVVLADQTVALGSPNNRAGAVLPGMRLVTSRNPAGEAQRFVTDRFDLAAADVVALYRKRWRIELFFRWLKHQLRAAAPLGHSREAVWLTALVAATVAALAVLLDPERPRAVSRIAWLRAAGWALPAGPHLAAPPPPDTS